jgi:hypothetical protein
MKSYQNGQIVAWYDWRTQGRDISGNGNDLSGTGGPIIRKF